MARAPLILDRYEPIGTAGSGGFGTVQIAWDPRIQRKVAIKTIQLTEQDAYRAALPGAQAVDGGLQPEEPSEPFHALANLPGLDEARTAAMLADQRIVTVFDFEVRERTAYLIMEYIEGITLTKILHEYADWATLDAVGAVFDAVAGALSAAHEAGVLHLDIKPDNILVNAKGEVKVTDFGLATLADASGSGKTGGGTIGYMPLEQMRREFLDARTDEWSLASVTYEMLTGENPFLAKDLSDAEAAIEEAELVLPSLCWDGIDAEIDDVVFRALDPDLEDRYPSVAEFAADLQGLLGDVPAGRLQLAAMVEDALGPSRDAEDDALAAIEPYAGPRQGEGVLGFLKSLVGGTPAESAAAPPARWEPAQNAMSIGERFDVERVESQDAEREEPAGKRGEKADAPGAAHVALWDRPGPRLKAFLARAFAAVASGALAFLAAVNMDALSAFGSGWGAVVAAFALAAAALAIVRPHIGALVSFALFGLALAMHDGVAVAIVLLVALAAWWHFVARKSVASSNVGLAVPLLGAVGGGPVAPLLAGCALRPVQALATSAFAVVCALALGAIGSGSLFGWDVQAHWLMGDVHVTRTFLTLAGKTSTWLAAAGWIAAAFVQSLVSMRGKRWMRIVGLVLSVVIVALSSMALTGPTLQAAVPLVAGFAALLAVMA